MTKTSQNMQNVSAGLIIFILLCVIGLDSAFGRIVYSTGSGDWQQGSTWNLGGTALPANGDTVVIQANHTVTVGANLYSATTYMFVVIVGTLDLGQVGKLGFTNTSKVIVETGGQILANGNGAQITLGIGNAEYKGQEDGNITGPSYIDNGHSPVSGEGFDGCGCYVPGSIPLPVILAAFSAEQSGKKVVLKWSTASEVNFSHFTVDRSTNGVDFSEIGEIEGHGNSNVRNDYSLDDVHPRIGKNYYRLKSTDFDGYTEYFDVVMEEYSGEREFTIYPNPSDGTTLNYMLNFSVDENSTIVVYNSVGVKVSSTFLPDQNNSLTFLSPLNRGVYFVKIVSKNFSTIERLIVR
jgi:hypothetical protein